MSTEHADYVAKRMCEALIRWGAQWDEQQDDLDAYVARIWPGQPSDATQAPAAGSGPVRWTEMTPAEQQAAVAAWRRPAQWE